MRAWERSWKRKGIFFTMPNLRARRLSFAAISSYKKLRTKCGAAAKATAAKIMQDVKAYGFSSVAKYAKKFDGVKLSPKSLFAQGPEFDLAERLLSSAERKAMLEMKRRISSFALLQKKNIETISQKNPEGETSLFFVPFKRIGIYVPAGKAPLFSSLFMAAIPAQVAGVKEIIVCSPPQKRGFADRRILAAARMCGISKVLKLGGAQAIAAMAFGLDGLFEPADMVCGPGNMYVNAAKMIAAGEGVKIDVPAGPSEILIVADGSADENFVAADMLAQAEHGEDSAAICICTDAQKAKSIIKSLSAQLRALPQNSPAYKSVAKWARVWVAPNLEKAAEAANQIAPEHVELLCKDARTYAKRISNAGAVFVQTAEAFCDYGMAGGNHILPTGGYAQSWGGVSVQSFGKWAYIEKISIEAQANLARMTAILSRMEGLEAHARSAEIRMQKR